MTARRLSPEELAKFRAAICNLPGCDCSRAKFGALTAHIEALEAELAAEGLVREHAASVIRTLELEGNRLRAEVAKLREAAESVLFGFGEEYEGRLAPLREALGERSSASPAKEAK